jgi:DNA-binding transcriptional MerR regulator
MAQQQPVRRKLRSSKGPVSIPDKLYFRIGDVSRLCSLPAYVLRFWETEFPQLKPNKGGTGQRLYRKRDVEMVLEIKGLLYDDGFTIAGARKLLAERRRGGGAGEAKGLHAVGAPAGSPQAVSERKSTAMVPASGVKKSAAGRSATPKIQDLRKEMRELLSLLGSDTATRKPQPVPARREGKKGRRTDEPTLF